MKRKPYFYMVIILLMVILSACSGTSTETTTSTTTTQEVTEIKGDSENGTDTITELIIGTLKLADTDYPVTAEQAMTMLPLWQLYQSMVSEDTTASEELDAIINQIEKVFTEDQLTEMSLFEYTNSMEMMKQLGVEPSASNEDGTEISVPDNLDEGNLTRGGGGGGGGGDGTGRGGGDFGGDDSVAPEFDPETMTGENAKAGGRTNNRQSLMFLPTLIEYLEELAGS